jgi:serine protease Do
VSAMRLLSLGVLIFCPLLMSEAVTAQSLSGSFHSMLFPEIAHGSYLGVHLQDISPDRARALKLAEPEGVEVTQVEPNSPAARAGIRPGDVLLTYNGENILGAEHLLRLVAETPEGRKIKIRFSRDGHEQTTVITTGARPGNFPFEPGAVMVPSKEFFDFKLPDMPAPLLVWKTSIGIECEPIEGQLAQYFGVPHGVLVRSVEKDSPSEKAGLRAGDVLVALGDHSVASPKDVTTFLRIREPGKPIPATVMRDHHEMHFTISETAAR